jgi:isoquinoline 1-oxidoreductase beta subunit
VKVIEGEFAFPYLAHAPMEPLNCTVKISTDGCEIWTGTQMPGNEQEAAAKVLGIPKEKVKVNTMFLGGGFGRRGSPHTEWVIEATEIAKASGEFIKMIWSREDDITGQHYRPLTVHKIKIGLDKTGMPVAWQQNIVSQSIYLTNVSFASFVKNGVDPSTVEGAAESHYQEAIPNMFVGCHITENPVSVLWWRSVGNNHTAYVVETMIDQAAHAAKKEPLAYRRELLKHAPRSLAVLNVAAEKAGWDKPLPPGRYRGVAVHTSFRSYVAQVVEISLADGKLIVHKVTCAVDCGLAVNPDGVRMQMESSIIFGLTMALYGELSIENGQVMQHNFYDYKMARMNEAPQIDVHLVPNSGQMGGIGEPGLPPFAPALANAIFSATGELIYDLPLMNHKLKPA